MRLFLKSKYITVSLHVLIWSMLLLTPYLILNAHKVNNLPGIYFVVGDLTHIALFYINAFYLFPRFLNRRRWGMFLLGALALIACTFESKLLIQRIFFPTIQKEFASTRFLLMPAVGTFVISCIYRIILDRIRFEREQKERQAAQLATELKFLRSQISPHFLFNVLTNLVSLARKRSDRLEPALIRLADLMRYMLYDTQGKKVTLGTEIDYLNSYIELQKLRFGNDIAIATHIGAGDPERSLVIEPMLLIPFVENAFKHGVGHTGEPRIDIRLSVDQEWMQFEVRNTVFDPGPQVDKDGNSGLGLNNVVTRLKLLYPDHHTLTIRNQDDLFHIHLTLKLI
ncbi:MAG TPA: sensor histidine kinase [Puia sp.]|nr:sensor histidine kinase [Puia sp.]